MSVEIKDTENVVIVGSGPAGYTAALYTSRADLEPIQIEGFAWGGLLQQTTDVENYPGYPEGVMGAEPKKLGIPGEDELAARGISYCATCDAAFHRDAQTIVVGGGDTAMEDATFLSKFAGKVSIVHRRPEFRASAIMLDRARDTKNIELVTPYVVQSFEAGENGSLSKAVLENTEDNSTKELPVTGAFVAIGHKPNSHLIDGQLDLDNEGYVLVEGRSTKTKRPGVFAAGDLTDRVYRQAVTAAGTGCMAALDAEAYLRDTPIDAEAHWAPDPEKVAAAGEKVEAAAE